MKTRMLQSSLSSLVDVFADLFGDDLIDLPVVPRCEAGGGGGHGRVRPLSPAP